MREVITLGDPGGHVGHGGGDYGLMKDLLKVIRSSGQSEGLTSAAKSVQNHMIAFAAEQSRVEKRIIDMRVFAKAQTPPF